MKTKYKRAWTSEGLDRSGTGDKLFLRESAANMTFAASLPIHSRPSTTDWCNMQVNPRESAVYRKRQLKPHLHSFSETAGNLEFAAMRFGNNAAQIKTEPNATAGALP